MTLFNLPSILAILREAEPRLLHANIRSWVLNIRTTAELIDEFPGGAPAHAIPIIQPTADEQEPIDAIAE
jgi:hypothetical protein